MGLSDQELERYSRHILLPEIGGAGQASLRGAKVLIIGAGGLGAPVLLYLAAAGVGTIGIVDDDDVALSNLQRQIIFRHSDLAASKAERAASHAWELNRDITITAHPVRLTQANAEELIAPYDLVADGCDNFTTRLLVSDACVRLQKTLVSAAIRRFDGQLGVFKPHMSPDLPCYRCLVSEVPTDDDGDDCATHGVIGAIAGVLGAWQAMEVVREITGFGPSIAGSLILFDALETTMRKIRLKPDPACPACR